VTDEPGLAEIRIAAFVACLVAVGLVGWVAFTRRSRPMEPSDRWMLLIGFLVLAPLAYLLNAGLAISGAKSVAFCDSCHVMNAYVADLQNPDSEHLAAQHYQFRWIADHQCYTCHSDYGLFGDMQAKMAGLRHVWFYNLGGYEVPLKIRGTYNNQRCLFCHGPTKNFQEESQHQKNMAAINTSEKSCIGGACHVSPHPKEAARPESAHAS
jgi:nitrate/TMAO reductase-like tetraheme cytochrome c subunit